MKLYLSLLKSHPWCTHLGSSLVLMSAGDIMAQEIELHRSENGGGGGHTSSSMLTASKSLDQQEREYRPKSNIQRYDSMSSKVCRLDEGGDTIDELQLASDYYLSLRDKLRSSFESFRSEVAAIDLGRTSSMVVWAVGAYTPFHVILYKFYDLYLPGGVTPFAVLSRVGLSLLSSIPLNAAFYMYGSYANYVQEWVAEVRKRCQQQRFVADAEDDTALLTDAVQEVPFDFERAWSDGTAKVESQLWDTTVTSGIVWAPFNIVNFSLVPPHLRPLTMMVCSTFWNAYLSLSQYSDDGSSED